jgi:hypothetical protein
MGISSEQVIETDLPLRSVSLTQGLLEQYQIVIDTGMLTTFLAIHAEDVDPSRIDLKFTSRVIGTHERAILVGGERVGATFYDDRNVPVTHHLDYVVGLDVGYAIACATAGGHLGINRKIHEPRPGIFNQQLSSANVSAVLVHELFHVDAREQLRARRPPNRRQLRELRQKKAFTRTKRGEIDEESFVQKRTAALFKSLASPLEGLVTIEKNWHS